MRRSHCRAVRRRPGPRPLLEIARGRSKCSSSGGVVLDRGRARAAKTCSVRHPTGGKGVPTGFIRHHMTPTGSPDENNRTWQAGRPGAMTRERRFSFDEWGPQSS